MYLSKERTPHLKDLREGGKVDKAYLKSYGKIFLNCFKSVAKNFPYFIIRKQKKERTVKNLTKKDKIWLYVAGCEILVLYIFFYFYFYCTIWKKFDKKTALRNNI